MAASNLRKLLRVPGRLSYGATSLATAYPHGGTALGTVRQIELKPAPEVYLSRREGFGNKVVEAIHLGEAWALACSFRARDKDVLNAMFFSSVTGASGEARVRYPGPTDKPGLRWTTRGVKLVFSPDDETNHAFVVMYRALPMPEETAALAMQLREEHVLAAVFLAVPDDSGNFVDWGIKGDVSL